jgi:outer membrane protein assembly factor BamB
LWFSQNFYAKMAVDESGVSYVMTFSRESLVAIENRSGAILWQVALPLERGGGARGLLANQNTVFVVTSIEIDAYEATTGALKWSTNLGGGHVSIVSQLDSDTVRIYYGDKLFEIDPETGKILSTAPKDSIIWVSGNVVIKTQPNNRLAAFDKQTDESLWTKCDMCDMFYAREDKEPQHIDTDTLIVGYKDKRICALDLLIGKDRWCRPEAYISKVAIDHQSQLGYAMRDDMVLVTIDLQTGNVLGETSFLSSEPAQEYFGFVPIVFSDGTVVVSFGDSGQTFGLKFRRSE